MSVPPVAVPVVAVAVLVAFACACATPLLGALLAWLDARSGRTRGPAAHAGLVLAPWVVGALAAAALVSPLPFEGCHCAEHGLHHPHLCLLHPGFAGPLVTPALVILAAWCAFALPRVVRLARDVVASARWARGVRGQPPEQVDGVAIRLVRCGAATAFTVGVVSPVIVSDPRLWSALRADERRAVVHHEAAHHVRGDGLTLLVLRLATTLLPYPGAGRLLARWRLASELECDAHAAARVGDPALVAEALLAALEIRAGHADAALPADALGVAGPQDLERRVLALVDDGGRTARAPRLGNDALAVLLVAFGAGALTLVSPGETVHHIIETAVGLLFH